MGCEISSIEGKIKGENHAKLFAEIYNSVMSEKEDWFESENELSFDMFDEEDDEYTFETDTYGVFEDPYETALRVVAAEFVKAAPDAEFEMTYDISWDNSYENWTEEYTYSRKRLKIEFIDNFNSDGQEYIEGIGYGPYETETYCLSYKDGAFEVIEGSKEILNTL